MSEGCGRGASNEGCQERGWPGCKEQKAGSRSQDERREGTGHVLGHSK